MLSLPPSVRVFVVVAPFDMRGSFDALAGAVRRLGMDPINGHLYLFLNKRRRLAKRCGSMVRGGWYCPSGSREAASSCLRSLGTPLRFRSTAPPSPRCWPASTSRRRGAARLASPICDHGPSHGDRQRAPDVIWCGGGHPLGAAASERRASRAARADGLGERSTDGADGLGERSADGAAARDERRADSASREAQ